MEAIETALTTSVLGTARVFVVLLMGFLAAKFPSQEPLLTKQASRCISRVCALLFLPALMIASTGATLNSTALMEAWQLVVAASFTISFSGLVAWVAGRALLRCPEDRRAFRPVALAIAFPNAVSFPLLLMDALCEQEYINSDFDNDAGACMAQATGMIFMYMIVWQSWFYGWGFYALGRDDILERKLIGQQVNPSPGTTAHDVELSSRSQLSTALPQQQREGGGGGNNSSPLQEGTDAADDNASEMDMNRLMAETYSISTDPIGSGDRKDAQCQDDDLPEGLGRRVIRIFLSPNIVAVVIGLGIAMISPLQEQLFGNPTAMLRPLGAAVETVGKPLVAVSTLVMAGSLMQVPTVAMSASSSTQDGHDDALQRWRRFRVLVRTMHMVCRLVVVPAVGFALFWVAKTHSSVMGENRLMHLILLVELAMPSAALIIVSLNQLRMPATAGFAARLYLWHYGASMLTITAWTAFAVHLVY